MPLRVSPPTLDGPGRAGRRRGGPLAAVLTLVLAAGLAACSSSSSPASTTAVPSTTRPVSTTAPAGAAAVPAPSSGTAPVYEVKTGTVPGLGTVLVAGNGFTLYLFVPDTQSGKSTCYSARAPPHGPRSC